MLKWLTHIFNFRHEEGRIIILLLSFSFFTGLSIALFYTASTTIFLDNFTRSDYPYAYLAMGLVGYISWWVLSFLDRYVNFSLQLLLKFLFLVLTVAFLCASWSYTQHPILAFGLFIWIRVLLLFTTLVFWSMAGKIFNLQQGKRLFGLIASGEVISSAVGFFSIPIILNYRLLDISGLLVLSSSFISVAWVILAVIVYMNRSVINDHLQARPNHISLIISLRSWKKYLAKPYFQYIFLLAFLPVFVLIYVDFIFLDHTSAYFQSNTDELASFLALFFGIGSILELIIKSLVSGRLLSKYGIKIGLILLPLFLLLISGISVIFGSLMGEESILFFYCVAGAKFLDRIGRSSIYEPAFQILYQPLPATERIPFQSKVEGIPKTMGNIVAGIVLILFVHAYPVGLVWLLALLSAISGVWWFSSSQAWQEYRQTLLDALRPKSSVDSSIDEHLMGGLSYIKYLLDKDKHKLNPAGKFIWSKLQIYQASQAINQEALTEDSSEQKTTIYLDQLNHPETTLTGIEQLIATDNEAVPLIEQHFQKKISVSVQLKLIWIQVHIAFHASCRQLFAFINYCMNAVRPTLNLAINQKKCEAGILEKPNVKKWIFTTIEHIIWIYACLYDLSGHQGSSKVFKALEDEQVLCMDQLFSLLGSLYGHENMGLIRDNLVNLFDEHKNTYAIELIDLLLEDEIKQMVIAICEPIPLSTKMKRIEKIYPQLRMTVEERLRDIIYQEKPLTSIWTKTQALVALSGLNKNLSKELLSLVKHPSPLIHETARQLLRFPTFYQFDRFPPTAGHQLLPLFQRVHLIQQVPCFIHTAGQHLCMLGEIFQGKYVKAGEQLECDSSFVYWLVKGIGAIRNLPSSHIYLLKSSELYLPLATKENQHIGFLASRDSYVLFSKAEAFYDFIITDQFLTNQLLSLLQLSPSFSLEYLPFTEPRDS